MYEQKKKTESHGQWIFYNLIELELLGRGDLRFWLRRFFSWDSLTGVSSTTRVAMRRASSSQPTMAAADLKLGLKMPCFASSAMDREGRLNLLCGRVLLALSWATSAIPRSYSFRLRKRHFFKHMCIRLDTIHRREQRGNGHILVLK